MSRARGRKAIGIVSLAVLVVSAVTFGAEPPDSAVNPRSGYIEVADAAWSGANYHIRHTINRGGGAAPLVALLSASPLDDLDPRLAVTPAGDVWIVWWRNGSPGQVLVRQRTYASGVWSAEQVISGSGESSRNPQIVFDGAKVWVAYEFAAGDGRAIAAIPENDPEPWPGRIVIATTTWGDDLDLRINHENAALWITWVDSSANVGWAQYSYTTRTWSSPAYESYAGDNIAAARARVRATVLGG